MNKLTKILAAVAVASTLTLGAAAIAGCSGNGSNNIDKITEINTPQEAYGFSASTAGMLISGMQGGSAATLASVQGVAKHSTMAAGKTQVTDQQTIDTLNEYMMLVEGLLSDGNFNISAVQNGDEAYTQYSLKMTVSYSGLNGEKLEYVTYYNQELIGSHTEQDDEPWEDEEVTEIYSIDGIMVIDGVQYPMEGRFVSQTEGRESENTHSLRVTLDEAADKYLSVTQESESEGSENEAEYVYSVYSGRTLEERTTFEYETERGEQEIEMTIYNRAEGTNSRFAFEKETEHGKEYIKIIVGGKGGTQVYTVRAVTDENGNSQYEYYNAGGDRVGRGERFDFDD